MSCFRTAAAFERSLRSGEYRVDCDRGHRPAVYEVCRVRAGLLQACWS